MRLLMLTRAASSQGRSGAALRPIRKVGFQVGLLALLALSFGAGCSDKTPESPYEDVDSAGMGESDIGGSGSSLDQFRRGTLGSGSYGPLDDIFFGYDAVNLSDEARETLNLNAEWLRANPQARVELEGHCDNRGTVEYNLALGARRATAARDYLVSLGIAGERLTTISYGEELPVCQDETEDCWTRNRRVHFVVLS
jgi:peptidoglycan-associated lipoprotein